MIPRRTIYSLVFFLILAILSLLNVPVSNLLPGKLQATPTPSPLAQKAGYALVTRVIDGDTIEINNSQKVRYIGMDTPELHKPQTPVQCFAQTAKDENEKLVLGKQVKLVKDVSETDRYGRLLRYVYLDKVATSTPVFVNEYLVKEGYAQIDTFPPDVRFQGLFLKAQQDARSQNKGLWANCLN